MKTLQVGAAGNDAHKISPKMCFLDTMSVCSEIAVYAKRSLQVEDKSRAWSLLMNSALLVILAKWMVSITEGPLTTKTFAMLAYISTLIPMCTGTFRSYGTPILKKGDLLYPWTFFLLQHLENFSRLARLVCCWRCKRRQGRSWCWRLFAQGLSTSPSSLSRSDWRRLSLNSGTTTLFRTMHAIKQKSSKSWRFESLSGSAPYLVKAIQKKAAAFWKRLAPVIWLLKRTRFICSWRYGRQVLDFHKMSGRFSSMF